MKREPSDIVNLLGELAERETDATCRALHEAATHGMPILDVCYLAINELVRQKAVSTKEAVAVMVSPPAEMVIPKDRPAPGPMAIRGSMLAEALERLPDPEKPGPNTYRVTVVEPPPPRTASPVSGITNNMVRAHTFYFKRETFGLNSARWREWVLVEAPGLP